MKRLSSRHLLWISLAAFAVVIAAEGVWLRREQLAARRAQAALDQKRQERDWLAAQTPALGAENEEAISADLAAARQALADAKAALRRGETGRWVEPAPTQTLEAYFNIASFVERNRAAAGAARVTLRPEERFGFAAFANEGPAVEMLPQVHRQLLVADTLVAQLIEAHPLALLALRREAAGRGQAAAKGQAEDYFVMDRALSVRRPGEVETVAFRVEFSGQTATLRNFLTGLAALPQPFLVRSVEVEPMPAGVAATSPVAGAPEAPVPLVRQNLSRFAVIVESVLLAGAPAKAP
jgi:hypothetical protein